MSSWTETLAIAPGDDGTWRLLAPLRWSVGRKASGFVVWIPAGFETDLATIPWFARAFFRTADPRYAKAAVLHDWLLASEWDGVTAAAEFRSALLADGVPRWEAAIMFAAVAWRHRNKRG